MNVRRFAVRFEYSLVGVLVLVCCWSSRALAQAGHGHATQDRTKTTSALIEVVRQATERFKDVKVAEGEEYGLLFGCVSGSDSGAMGLHYVKQSLLMDGDIDPANPEIVIYEPVPNGPPRLIGADYLVFKDAWDAKHPDGPPQMMGQLLHLFESPNRFGLQPFYTLHVWAWKDNPNGAFVNWHPNVSCDAFGGQHP